MAIIQARKTSTRFPDKISKYIGGKTMLWRVIQKVKQAKSVNEVILATPHHIESNIPEFIGSERDLLDRYYQCAKEHKADIIVRVTSDCPFICPDLIDLCVGTLKHYGLKFIRADYYDGLDTEVFTFQALEEAWNNVERPEDREHVTPYMRRCFDRDLADIKLSVDTEDDLNRLRCIDGLV